MTEKDMESKFSRLFSKFSNEKKANEIINLVRKTDHLKNMSALIAALEKRN